MTTFTETHTNFMGESAYEIFNPIRRLMMPLLSGFLGEPSYYMPNKEEEKPSLHIQKIFDVLKEHLVLPKYFGVSRQKVFYDAVNDALEFDFGETLNLAIRARNEWFMRKSPAQLLAIAASHPNRIKFNEENPKTFRDTVVKCCPLPGDMISIVESWKALHGSKSKFPSFMKRAFEDRLLEITPYHCGKYSKAVIDVARISHPSKKVVKSTVLDPLMTTGTVELDDEDTTWEKHRSQGKTWSETFEAMGRRLPHMAALRNLRGFASSDPGEELMKEYCDMVLSGVHGGKQFPFRYIAAHKAMKSRLDKPEDAEDQPEDAEDQPKDAEDQPEDADVQPKKGQRKPPKPVDPKYVPMIMDCLEQCLQASLENFPKLEGNSMVMSDNGGSAHGAFTSTYGQTSVADIGNLSALFTALCCTGRGVVGLFGDHLVEYEVDKSRPILEQYEEIRTQGETVGQGTENGVWLFFKRAFDNPDKYKFDNWFCYSDMQVGHGGLYGNDPEIQTQGFAWKLASSNTIYVDVHKCITKYRREINPKLNTFMVQTAGYIDTILPESTYRGAILSGWTGNEVVYANEITKLWCELEKIA